MTRHQARIEKNWREIGLARVAVWRTRGDGHADLAIFLVDCWCLGVKNALYEEDVPLPECEEFVRAQLPEELGETIPPACAKKIVDGALAFAERLGFSPHRDYRKARRVLGGVDASLCPEDFVFGKDGRPHFVPGPDDDQTRIDRVIAILTARCGPDGFDVELHDEDEDREVRLDLRDFFDEESDDAPRFYAVSGMITALHIVPQPISPEKLLETLWPAGSRTWNDAEEAQAFLNLFLKYWNYCGDLVANSLTPDAPPEISLIDVYDEDFDEEENEQDARRSVGEATIDWAIGFMRTTQLWPEAWGEALTRSDLAPHWEILRLWSELPTTHGNVELIAAAAKANPPRTLHRSVPVIAWALRRASPRP